ncbi:hypothetical protein BDQ17DRAFT_1336286 [Cyathus striatus]|nr:hypothetical protein BDQ17DRAFT_1336286 [Cyathus striatus]
MCSINYENRSLHDRYQKCYDRTQNSKKLRESWIGPSALPKTTAINCELKFDSKSIITKFKADTDLVVLIIDGGHTGLTWSSSYLAVYVTCNRNSPTRVSVNVAKPTSTSSSLVIKSYGVIDACLPTHSNVPLDSPQHPLIRRGQRLPRSAPDRHNKKYRKNDEGGTWQEWQEWVHSERSEARLGQRLVSTAGRRRTAWTRRDVEGVVRWEERRRQTYAPNCTPSATASSPSPSSTHSFLSSSPTLSTAAAISVAVRPTTSLPLIPRLLVHNDNNGTSFSPPPLLIHDDGDNGSKSGVDSTMPPPSIPLLHNDDNIAGKSGIDGLSSSPLLSVS